MDSVALSIANGAKFRDLSLRGILQISFIYAFFQSIIPLFGYYLGLGFFRLIDQIDHFIAFSILSLLGYSLIKESKEGCSNLINLDLKTIITGAIATSIDALAVGVTLGIDKKNIYSDVFVIGVVCLMLCAAAFYVGKIFGKWLEKRALLLGGVILISIGVKILLTHLDIINI